MLRPVPARAMKRVDFYQLSRDPAPRVAAMLAAKVLASGARAVAVAEDEALLDAIAEALWAEPQSFLANGRAGEAGEERQPVLLSRDCAAANGATVAILADGTWRDAATGFERALLLFGPERTGDARALWRRFDGEAQIERRIFKQDDRGRWREGG